jgi:hypothetical protein
MTPQEMMGVIQAYVDGKRIQKTTSGRNNWVDEPLSWSISWDFSNYDYRIKPEPRIIYVNEYPDGIGGLFHHTVYYAKISAAPTCIRQVKFIEVLE